MKKDIDTFIAEERAEILSKYDRVRHYRDKLNIERNMGWKQCMKHECVSCGCFRADRRVSILTLGRMLTLTSIRSLTVLDFCSKLQLSSPSPSSASHHVNVFNIRVFISAPAKKSCQLPARSRRRYEHFKLGLCSHTSHMQRPKCLSISPQQKLQELKRVEKWLKMVKNWDKYRNSEKVCESFQPHTSHFWPYFHLSCTQSVVLFPFSL